MATKPERAIKELAEAVYRLSQAVESLAKDQGDSRAKHLATSARSKANHHR